MNFVLGAVLILLFRGDVHLVDRRHPARHLFDYISKNRASPLVTVDVLLCQEPLFYVDT